MSDQNGSSANAYAVFPEQYRILLEDATSGDFELYEQAVSTLQSMTPDEAVSAIQDLNGFVHHSDYWVRFSSAYLMINIDLKGSLEFILPLLQDSHPHVRYLVMIELAYNLHDNEDERLVEPLINVLMHDSDDDARASAAFLLGDIGDRRALEALRHAQDHDLGVDYESVPVWYRAKEAIERIMQRNTD